MLPGSPVERAHLSRETAANRGVR